MQFFLAHVDAHPGPDDEVTLLRPGGPKTALMIPLDAVPWALGALARESVGENELVACEGCGELLPGRKPDVD